MLKNYIKVALKVLLRRKFFTFISLFAISFTLVVLMTATAIFDHEFAPMAPETRQDRMLGIHDMMMSGKDNIWTSSAGFGLLDKYGRDLHNVEMMSIYTETRKTSSYKDGYEIKSDLKYTDGNFWKILDFTFLEGGPFTSDDDRLANFVAVINQTTKEKFFGSGPAVGKFIDLDQRSYRVVGVVADVPIFRETSFSEIWTPVGTYPGAHFRSELMGDFRALYLAHSSADFDGIKSEFSSRMKLVQFPDKDYDKMTGVPETHFETVARGILDDSPGTSHPAMFVAVMLVAMFLFMLLPTINLININVSRIIERASEIGVRKSFGASSRTLVGQFIVENIILTFIGGIIGFLLSLVVLHLVETSNLLMYAKFHINYRVFLYGMILIVIFGMLSGVYPAWKMSRMNPVQALKGIVQ